MTYLPSSVRAAGSWRLVVFCLSAILGIGLVAGSAVAVAGGSELEGSATGTDATPARGTDTTPARGTDTTPARGTDTTVAPGTDTPPASTPDRTEPPPGDSGPTAAPDSPRPPDAGSGDPGFSAGTDERQFQGSGVGVTGAPVPAPAAPAAPAAGEMLAGTGGEPLLEGLTGLGILLLGAGLRIGLYRCRALWALICRPLQQVPRFSWLLRLSSAMAHAALVELRLRRA
jgi:hypothetical protein